ncbi:MAG: TetR/AcrR family transcriptional regulator [Clostridia bacterium]|nr:TetR/AcrR family transcriptional regulator [Clostridia bacterium]
METPSKGSVKTRVLQTAIKMFLQNGYKKTTLRDIASQAKVNYGSLTFAFKTKEALVCELVGYVIDCQFEIVSNYLKGVCDDKILEYAVETCLQLHISEMNEQMKEMYIVSYSMANSSQVIYNNVTKKLQYIFKEQLPYFEEKDFYELEIAAAGIMRNFLTISCDKYFTIGRKINRFLETTFLIYRVSDEKIKEVIDFVKQIDFEKLARLTSGKILGYIESRI